MKDIESVIRRLNPADRKALQHDLTDVTRCFKTRCVVRKIDDHGHIITHYNSNTCANVELLFFFPSVLLVLQIKNVKSSSKLSGLFRGQSSSAIAPSTTTARTSTTNASATRARSGGALQPVDPTLSSEHSSSKQKSKAVLSIELSTPTISLTEIDRFSFQLTVTRGSSRTLFRLSDFVGSEHMSPCADRCLQWKNWLLEAIDKWSPEWGLLPTTTTTSTSSSSSMTNDSTAAAVAVATTATTTTTSNTSGNSTPSAASGTSTKIASSLSSIIKKRTRAGERTLLNEPNIRVVKDRDGNRVLQKATIDELLNIITGLYDNTKFAVEIPDNSRNLLIDGVLLVYRAYMSPEALASKLLNILHTNASVPAIRAAVFTVFDMWTHRYRADFTQALVFRLSGGIAVCCTRWCASRLHADCLSVVLQCSGKFDFGVIGAFL
jgi:hypothetical protein